SGDQWLVLPQWPVENVATIHVDDGGFWGQVGGSFGSASLLTEGTDYALVIDTADGYSRKAMVFRINNVWDTQWDRPGGMLASLPESGRGNIKVVLTSGFDKIPEDVSLAAAMVVSKMRAAGPFGFPLTSEHYEDYGYTLGANLATNAELGFLGGGV